MSYASAFIDNLGPDLENLYPGGNVSLPELMLLKKLSKTIEEKDYGVKHLTKRQQREWQPIDDDIPSLVESINFWRSCQPKRPEKEWGAVDYQLSIEAAMKEQLCLGLLAKITSMKPRRRNVSKKNITY
tara:strand:+ start:979 stop:1365 length:387 start_codon:yes stop_codon:yes gene_type:complete